MTGSEIALVIAVVVILLCQANWLFSDARKHSRYPWFWGIWGLVQFPIPLLFYWLIVRMPKRVKNKRGGGNSNID
ncbi:transcriptional regulator [Paenibacillus rhizovicinus]|uniref:Transcriptional regulator n=1 Tax=Paenibacillus rhizovicinus TaxID=2704463 RepID=A0A6C0P3M8_9BACL|nr:transcriptional regulator [Paenibacillus rhizovicinus]QHW33124.1 transcriptional regulator [Paenibacillus rhizovicinus]